MEIIEDKIFILSLMVIISIFITKLTKNYGIPTLLLFIALGMLAGSDGPGGLEFSNASLAQAIGTVTLVFILFSGGLDTSFSSVRRGIKSSISLATFGVILTAALAGGFLYFFAGFSLLYAFLIGAVISSTDAAAVLSVLRAKDLNLSGDIQPVLEVESGSNDPMAILLTTMMISIITTPEKPFYDYILFFILQFGVGALAGYAGGRGVALIMNKLDFITPGFYPVFALAGALLIYSGTVLIAGSGFLAIYIAGIVANNHEFQYKTSVIRFFDGLAWLSQICMFLALGLLINPKELLSVAFTGILLAVFLMFFARPVAVFISLLKSNFNLREKLFIIWGGLRGAVPIILATFALTADIPNAQEIFNLVFFVVCFSALGQGWSLQFIAKFLKVTQLKPLNKKVLLDIETGKGDDKTLSDFFIAPGAPASGTKIVELGLPKDVLIVLIERKGKYVIPSGATILEEDDLVILLADKSKLADVAKFFQAN